MRYFVFIFFIFGSGCSFIVDDVSEDFFDDDSLDFCDSGLDCPSISFLDRDRLMSDLYVQDNDTEDSDLFTDFKDGGIGEDTEIFESDGGIGEDTETFESDGGIGEDTETFGSECAWGVCCENGYFVKSSEKKICFSAAAVNFRCESDCGGSLYASAVEVYCSGSSSSCDGETVYAEYVYAECPENYACIAGNQECKYSPTHECAQSF